MRYDANEQEKEILAFWEKERCFERSVSERPEAKPYVFYDGPPFATGLPHYGHIVASLMKDVVPRFWTMRGFRVERKWGWDCHGLPIENIIEKKLDLNSRQAIEQYGVKNFNEACRAAVLEYAGEWKKTIRRMGRWVDMEHDYKTMDLNFMESVWWVFGELWKKGLIYKGYKAMHICPRCATTLSNFEVTQGYKDVKDISATIKFKVKSSKFKVDYDIDGDVYMLAWTTTPWTLPGNVLLAVGKDIEYVVVSVEGEEGRYVVAKERLAVVFKDKTYHLEKELKGSDLVGLTYEPLFPYFAETKNAFRVVAADFVSTEEGTGIVHIAPAFGDDDYRVGVAEQVPLVQHVTMDGKFVAAVTDFAGLDVKPIADNMQTDVEIIKWLAHNNKLFSKQKIEHSYPHCWRCDTPLLNYATSSWFVRVTEMKEQLLANNQQITWVPEHIKEGRFGKWLEGARDWAVSRSRFWGTPLPVWECQGEVESEKLKVKSQKCENIKVIGSVNELENLVGQKVSDLHKHFVDELTFACDKCGGEMKRVPEVLDCWFESGSMPYGEVHYPFENKAKFEAGFPAEFIAEGQDQTRGWFYTLHVLATALTSGHAFKNVIVNGIVLAEDGKKMSKRLKNYPEPDILLEKYGADAMRYYLVTSPVMEAEALNFSETGVREMYNKVVNTLWNVLEFYELYAGQHSVHGEMSRPEHVLDRWILAKLQVLITEVTAGMEAYRLVDASRPIVDFIAELSQWYVRRSRDRFKSDDALDRENALTTLRTVLLTLSQVMAPFTPFIAEKVYQTVKGKATSVHLETWPEVRNDWVNAEVLHDMTVARQAVEMGLALRAEVGIKVKQVLGELYINGVTLADEFTAMVADELNIKRVVLGQDTGEGYVSKIEGNITVTLATRITPELKREGLARELVRTINQWRKDNGLSIADRIQVHYYSPNEELAAVLAAHQDEVLRATLTTELVPLAAPTAGVEYAIGEMIVRLDIKKIN